MSSRKDFVLVRQDESQSFNSVMAREKNGSKQRLVRDYHDSPSDADSEDDGSLDSNDEEYLYSLNQKSRKSSNSDFWLKLVAAVSFCIIIVLAIVVAWQHFQTQQGQVCLTETCVVTSAYILNKMNTTHDPCDDFYEYACGGWLASTNVPPDKAKYGSFAEVANQNKAMLKKILDSEGSLYKGRNSSAIEKVKAYYSDCMDKRQIELTGITPALQLIEKLGSWTLTSDPISGTWDASQWNRLDALVRVHQLNLGPIFSVTIGQDSKHSDKNIISFQQSGLTLEQREEYFNNSEKYKEGYLGFAVKIAELLGADNSTSSQKMTEVYDFEKSLAEIFVSKEALQDPVATYNKMSLQDLQDIIGDSLSLGTFMNQLFGRDVPLTEEVLVPTLDYFKKLGDVLSKTSDEVLANYLVWQVLQYLPGYLPEKFTDAALILDKVETGVTEVGPRWQRCVYKATSALAYAVGALFVEEKFSPDSKEKAIEVIDDIKRAFMNNLIQVEWMDQKTRDIAIDKVKAVENMIGYPDFILDPVELDKHYENLTIASGHFLANRLSTMAWSKSYNLNKLGKAPDRREWHMAPSDVNAYYSPINNQIVFPAGILQSPYYSPDFPMSFLYGSLGMIVGHELTHGFDTNGRNFDKHGNLDDWWTNASAAGFKKKTECMINQYSDYTIQDIHLNGLYTKSENIADNGGLKTAHSAYLAAKNSALASLPLPGISLSPDQLFYVGFAQIWCSFYTPEYARETVMTDPHANAKYRVIGSVSNSDDFSKAYKCSAQSKMNPAHKCTVW